MLNIYKEQIKELINKIAKEDGKSSYLIPSEEEIERLLEVKPKTLTELGSIKGFPLNGKRVSRFGKDIVNIFNPSVNRLNKSNVWGA